MNLKDHAARVAVLKVLRDAVNAEYEAARRTVLDALCSARAEIDLKSVRATLPDGTPVAVLTLVDSAPTVVVADEDAFLAWVAEHHPSEVETRLTVRPGWQRQFTARLAARPGPVTDPRTGEVIPGLAASAPGPRAFSLRSLPGGKEEITRAWHSGALDPRRLLALDGDA